MSPDIKPFLPSRPSGPIFIALNVLRLLSIIALLLCLAANCVTMASDIKAIKHSPTTSSTSATGSNSTTTLDEIDCDYYEYSTVPDQTGGPFWSILNRLFIVFECLLLTFAEVGFPKRLFEDFVPVLGPGHGLGCLGVFQALYAALAGGTISTLTTRIGAQVLSHYCDLFPQVTSWLLFIIGCLNIVAGLVFRSKAKPKRLIFSWENVSSLTPQTRMAATAWDMVSEKRRQAPSTTSEGSAGGSQPALSRSASQHSDTPLLPTANVQPGARFGGFGFGKQGERQAAERGFKISRPLETLPKYVV